MSASPRKPTYGFNIGLLLFHSPKKKCQLLRRRFAPDDQFQFNLKTFFSNIPTAASVAAVAFAE
jgi:hypothetical protein